MSPRTELEYSKKRVRRAGVALRDLRGSLIAGLNDAELSKYPPDYVDAVTVAQNWRAHHSHALQLATNGLRSRVRTSTGEKGDVSQRLKRITTIIDKLRREPTMQLDTMRDIAGCRAVVRTVDDVRKVQRQWQQTFRAARILRVYDYIARPKDSGYRALHLYVVYDGLPVEVQVRSQAQHEWAIALEQLGARTSFDLKSSKGPKEILDFFVLASEAMAIDESGKQVPASLTEAINEARLNVLQHLKQPGGPPTPE